ncbi:MAG TPA: sulfurtransferase [Xanthomonadaceae bacterium]|nr:sulfurtransferase [Xanthomonadaceae bacterium]
MNWSTLVQAETLAGVLRHAGLVVVDCRFSLADTAQGERDYTSAHIPGACYAHLDRDLSRLSDDPRDGRHPWPDPDAFARTIAGWGIGPDDQVVVYDADNGSIAARLWSLLRSHGHGRVAVLDGGWARWVALGLPVESGGSDAPLWEPPRRRSPSPNTSPPWRLLQEAAPLERLLDADAVQAHLDAGGLLVDARAAPRFRGELEPLDRVAGHVPGAVNRPFADNLQDDGRFKSPERLSREFQALLGEREPSSLVAMCGSGVTACHHLLAMAHAGLPVGRLYAGSWSGWIGDPRRPVARDA